MTVEVPFVPGLLPTLVGLWIAVTAAGQHAKAQDSAAPAAKKESGRAERLDEMKQIAVSFQAVAIDGDLRKPAVLAGEPLYRWNDPTREFSDGTLWFWRYANRPIAVVAIELYPQNSAFGTVWALEFTSLSTRLVEVEGGEHFDIAYSDLYPPRPDGRLRWAPEKGGIELHDIADAPAPASTEAERLRQMKELVRRFSARELFQSREYSLRLISRPIDRYADPASGLLDGEIFIYANGTNPEVLLMIEARRRDGGFPSWSYAAAPLARAELTVRLDRQDVWNFKSKKVPSPADSYFLARRRHNPAARD